ncbi:unnamed protein product [Phytophthora fragariaefolia]|uniref:Unnamed protein product n=1 Tax=Phytophthora fragariaefolia TaxID=1490495 RepID=A0A9W7D7U2_9STRA|nr:unnamed protein product [Phytophthora fragariaefolia]
MNAYTAAQVLYDIDCKFAKYIDLPSEPEEGYFIRLELLKEIREWYFEMEFKEEDDWNQSSETNDSHNYSSDAVFFEGFSRMIQSQYKIFVNEYYCERLCECGNEFHHELMSAIF